MKNLVVIVLSISLLANLYFLHTRRPEVEITRTTDTLWKDTVIRDSFPYPVYVETVRNNVDSLFTVDSVLVPVYLPIEQKQYETADYKAVVEGYNPRLVSIDIYQRYPVITNTDTKYIKSNQKWGIGIQAGYGISSDRAGPYIGIGIQYNLFSF